MPTTWSFSSTTTRWMRSRAIRSASSAAGVVGLTVADFDRDGDQDVAIAANDGNFGGNVSWFRNAGGQFALGRLPFRRLQVPLFVAEPGVATLAPEQIAGGGQRCLFDIDAADVDGKGGVMFRDEAVDRVLLERFKVVLLRMGCCQRNRRKNSCDPSVPHHFYHSFQGKSAVPRGPSLQANPSPPTSHLVLPLTGSFPAAAKSNTYDNTSLARLH